jgi:hypothetical protein
LGTLNGVKRLLTLALATVALATLAAAAGAAATPTLRLVNMSPLVVRGTAFAPREAVTVSSPYGRIQTRATATGAFVVRFGGVPRCSSGGVVLARGAHGERVTLRLPLTMCAPAMGQ